jgi:hypothetical protein
LWMREPWVSSSLAKAHSRNGQWWLDCPHVVTTLSSCIVHLIGERAQDLFPTNGELEYLGETVYRQCKYSHEVRRPVKGSELGTPTDCGIGGER